jgi:hypothetical protein
MFFFPLAHLIGADGNVFEFIYRGIPAQQEGGEAILKAWPIAILMGLIALDSLVTIFLYKKRMLQIRFTVFNILLMLGLMVLIYFNVSNQAEVMNASVEYKLVNVFPLISAILSYLAIRGIGKDEAMIRSMDRIR